MKYRSQIGYCLLLVLLVGLLSGCGEKNKDTNNNSNGNTPVPTVTEEATKTPTPTVGPTDTPTPTPRPPFGVTTMSLYKNRKDLKTRVRYGETYESEWVRGTDITSVECIASDVPEIPTDGRHYMDLWLPEWEKFDNAWDCKICYRVQFSTSDGLNVDKMLMKAGDELEYREYLENYLYDDIHVERGKIYDHLHPDQMKEDTILSSLKFTPGEKISKVYSPITVSAYIYYSDLDFDEDGNYVGSMSYTVQLVNSAENAITAPSPTPTVDPDKVTPEPMVPTKTEESQSPVVTTPAEKVTIGITNSNGQGSSSLVDGSYDTRVVYQPGETVTITSEEPMGGIYLIWGSKGTEYTLDVNGKTEKRGELGILHEYVAFSEAATECKLTLSEETSLCDIRAYTPGILPGDVQVWQAPYEQADMVIFSTHADDEVLFFGGAAVVYGGVKKSRVQLVYMCNYWNGERVREHEKLDGLWTMGLRAYPVNMPFADYYAKNLSEAKEKYSYDNLVTSVTENIRRFQPLIVVTHDVKGEYGHGGHMLLNAAVSEAVENSMLDTFRPESASQYGVWDVPKTYIHLWQENKIRLNLREALDELDGMTALEVAAAAYKKHVSQQKYWFYVSDDYEYSCADYGLYRTTVGLDSGNDMLEHLETYDQKEEKKRQEEERIALLTQAAQKAEEDKKLTQAAEKERAEEQAKQETAEPKAENEAGNSPMQIIGKIFKGFLIVILVVFALFAALIGALVIRKERRRRRRRELRRKRMMRERSRQEQLRRIEDDEE